MVGSAKTIGTGRILCLCFHRARGRPVYYSGCHKRSPSIVLSVPALSTRKNATDLGKTMFGDSEPFLDTKGKASFYIRAVAARGTFVREIDSRSFYRMTQGVLTKSLSPSANGQTIRIAKTVPAEQLSPS